LSSPFSALFRFSVAFHAGFVDLASGWFDAASEQYLKKPDAYRKSWGKFLPLAVENDAERSKQDG
jgi:hypothetical protein